MNFRILQTQSLIDATIWAELKRNEGLDQYVRRDMRQQIAAALLDEHLALWTVVEPDDEENPLLNRHVAIVRGSVALGSKSEAAEYAHQLAEAEARGFAKALAAMRADFERVAPRFGPTAYTRGALEETATRVERDYHHRPAADWRPITSLGQHKEQVEYLFADGTVGRSPTLDVVRADDVTPALLIDRLVAIAWRHRGRRLAVAADAAA